MQSSSNSLNKWRFDSKSIPWSWIGLIHAAHCSGKQCESIFNQTKYSVAYKSSRKSSYSCMLFKEVKLTVRCQIIVNKYTHLSNDLIWSLTEKKYTHRQDKISQKVMVRYENVSESFSSCQFDASRTRVRKTL